MSYAWPIARGSLRQQGRRQQKVEFAERARLDADTCTGTVRYAADAERAEWSECIVEERNVDTNIGVSSGYG